MIITEEEIQEVVIAGLIRLGRIPQNHENYKVEILEEKGGPFDDRVLEPSILIKEIQDADAR